MRNLVRSFINCESGVAASEYAMILAIVGIAILTAMTTLGGAISGAITSAATHISTGK